MRRAFFAASAFVLVFLGLSSLDAQVRPIYDLGASGLSQVLQRLQTTASVLHTGAHPDDEDSAFLARTARGDHARVAYLALNRGEGGQNIIGPELFEALGVIRTEELLQARTLDGGEQFFTRAIDYGFSKRREEAAARWTERDVLADMVRVIRMFRPLVIYSRFSGTPADGHGHHQLAGFLTPLAFRAAADPHAFPEQIAEGLRPWQAKKLYRGVGFRPDPANPLSVVVETGIFDAVLGRTYAEIANEGRSQHKTQDMGTIETRGPQQSGLIRLESFVSSGAREASVFEGIDTSVSGLATLAGLPQGALARELATMADAARRALSEYAALEPRTIIPALVDGLRATRAARTAVASVDAPADARADANFLLAFKEREFTDALTRAARVVVDPLADAETVVPGGTVMVTVRTFLQPGTPVTVIGATVRVPAGWAIEASDEQERDDLNPFARMFREKPTTTARHRVTAPADAPLTQPYYLVEPRDGNKYRWPAGSPKAMPFASPPLVGEVTLQVGGERVAGGALTVQMGGERVVVSKPVEFRFADRVRGELRRQISVVPPVAIGIDSPLLIVPLGSKPHQQRVVIRATSFSTRPVTGSLRLRVPQGWTSVPAEAPFTLKTSGDKAAAPFTVTAPASRTAGRVTVEAEAAVGRAVFSSDVQAIAYPHIQTHRIYRPASAAGLVFDLKIAPVHVGYIMGSGDQVYEALRRMGVDATLIDEERLATGDLSSFDTIVVGIRASEARPELVANNGRLLQYVERGGTLIVQYQQNDYVGRGLAPFPAEMASRVTDETAPVRILRPDHPLFTFPNRITDADFNGWVQERSLYAFTTFDKRYIPLLEAADSGEPPQRGGEVYARVGKGHYVYTAYAWFRQLPAGVPGAYRMFANLISLPKAPLR